MLVLTRNVGQTIIIDGGIRVHILGVNTMRQIRVGIDAPDDTRILRAELVDKKRKVKGVDE
jgi:carbon storage regulator CsrA